MIFRERYPVTLFTAREYGSKNGHDLTLIEIYGIMVM